jgi:uncharacterized protein with HEPN domain
MKKSYGPHLAIIRESIAAIERYRPASEADYLADPILQDAMLMRLHVIGEQLARMRQIDERRFNEAAAPSWYKIIGLRNIIAHGYETIHHDRIWLYVTEELERFAASLTELPPD